MKLDLHYTDRRLVALYDSDNPRGIDTEFFVSLANDINAKTILDLGCGTGLLARELIKPERNITGIDPSKEMIAWAKKQRDSEKINWMIGDASDLRSPSADFLAMTGNVSQVFLEDSEWLSTLKYIHEALRIGGTLAFESRNPNAQAWKDWIPEKTFKTVSSQFGPIEKWLELIKVSNGLVHFQTHNIFKQTGEVLRVDSTLRFRSAEEISSSLKGSGFNLKKVYGSWKKDIFEPSDKIMIFVAERL